MKVGFEMKFNCKNMLIVNFDVFEIRMFQIVKSNLKIILVQISYLPFDFK